MLKPQGLALFYFYLDYTRVIIFSKYKSFNKILKLEDEIREPKQELSFYKELYKNKLKGKKVLLIGDKKKEDEYKEIITSFNGQMQMLDSFDEFSKINSNTQWFRLHNSIYILHKPLYK